MAGCRRAGRTPRYPACRIAGITPKRLEWRIEVDSVLSSPNGRIEVARLMAGATDEPKPDLARWNGPVKKEARTSNWMSTAS